MIQPCKRFDPDVTFEDIYKIVLSDFDALERSLSLSDSDWVRLTLLRADVELLFKIHYGKTEKPSDV